MSKMLRQRRPDVSMIRFWQLFYVYDTSMKKSVELSNKYHFFTE